MKLNPRYLAYCAAHGKSVAEMEKHDAKRWPGGVMCGFILWIAEKKAAFKKTSPDSFIGPNVIDHAAFNQFLGA